MTLRKILYEIYWKIQGIIAPKLKYSQYLYEDVLYEYVASDTRWLDLGCGHQVLPGWRASQEKTLIEKCNLIIGVDADLYSLKRHRSIKLTIGGDIGRLPLKNDSFDLVTANMVVEHLDDPERQFREIYRVLKPGGTFIFHTVNTFGYYVILARLIPELFKKKLVLLFEDRAAEDVFPTCYRANSRKKIELLARKVGFPDVKVKLVASSAKFIIIPPLLIPELLWIRLTLTKPFKPLRTNIIAMLTK